MFIHNFTNDVLKYDSKGNIIKLKPNTITFVDDKLVKPEKLKECFGARIDIVDNVEVIGELFGTEQVRAEIEEEKAQIVDKDVDNEDKSDDTNVDKDEDKSDDTTPKATKEPKKSGRRSGRPKKNK